MRRTEQIQSLRKVIILSAGPFASLFMSDEEVDEWADHLQQKLDEDLPPTDWRLKIRTRDLAKKEWDDIPPEPTKPCLHLSTLKAKCDEYLERYPQILEILVYKANNPKEQQIYVKPKRRTF